MLLGSWISGQFVNSQTWDHVASMWLRPTTNQSIKTKFLPLHCRHVRNHYQVISTVAASVSLLFRQLTNRRILALFTAQTDSPHRERTPRLLRRCASWNSYSRESRGSKRKKANKASRLIHWREKGQSWWRNCWIYRNSVTMIESSRKQGERTVSTRRSASEKYCRRRRSVINPISTALT